MNMKPDTKRKCGYAKSILNKQRGTSEVCEPKPHSDDPSSRVDDQDGLLQGAGFELRRGFFDDWRACELSRVGSRNFRDHSTGAATCSRQRVPRARRKIAVIGCPGCCTDENKLSHLHIPSEARG